MAGKVGARQMRARQKVKDIFIYIFCFLALAAAICFSFYLKKVEYDDIEKRAERTVNRILVEKGLILEEDTHEN
jgi:hypothetical protein